MTLQTTKPISMADIEAEFSAPSGTPLSAFVAGGAFVPPGTTGVGGPVPTAKPISMTDLLGTSNEFVTLLARDIDAGGSGSATASVAFFDDGRLLTNGVDVPVIGPDEWLNTQPTGNGPGWDVRATVISGDTPSGPTLGVFHNISENRQWNLTQSFPGAKSNTMRFEIRPAGGGANVADVQMNLTAVPSA